MQINSEPLSTHQLVNIVSEFSRFLEDADIGMQEILQHLNRKSFVAFESRSVYFTQLNSFNELELELRSGVDIPKEFRTEKFTKLDSKLPIVDVFKSGKIMWINILPDWGVDYPLLKDYPIDLHGETFIGIPIVQDGSVTAVLSLICEPKLHENEAANDFFSTIAGLLALHLISPSG